MHETYFMFDEKYANFNYFIFGSNVRNNYALNWHR